MLFTRNKEQELWRCVCAPAINSMNSQPQLPLHHQLPHHRQDAATETASNLLMAHSGPFIIRSNNQLNSFDCDYGAEVRSIYHYGNNTPPPPYASISGEIDSSDITGLAVNNSLISENTQSTSIDCDSNLSNTSSESAMNCERQHKSTGNCENYPNTVPDSYTEWTNDNVISNTENSLQRNVEQNGKDNCATATTETFASSVVNIFRHCCGAGTHHNNILGISEIIDHTNNNTIQCKSNTDQCNDIIYQRHINTHEYFKELMRKLKGQQKAELLKAVKTPYERSNSTNCILIKKVKIFNEEPFVIACRLFLWANLRTATELRRSPNCPNGLESIYVCCNPLHWYRVIPTEPVFVGRIQNDDYAFNQTGSDISIPSAKIMLSQPYIQVSDSVTTNDEECQSSSVNWCKVAYWELSKRVGDCYSAKKSPINIFTEGTCADGLCLKELVQSKSYTSVEGEKVDKVTRTREKIGLGIMLHQESDGVWLYNRSMESIYIYSPSVQESWKRCLKVLPGHCLRAFDTYRAQYPIYTSHSANMHVGPVDLFRMSISFVKGWGCHYKRRDITGCPCWIEVFFKKR